MKENYWDDVLERHGLSGHVCCVSPFNSELISRIRGKVRLVKNEKSSWTGLERERNAGRVVFIKSGFAGFGRLSRQRDSMSQAIALWFANFSKSGSLSGVPNVCPNKSLGGQIFVTTCRTNNLTLCKSWVLLNDTCASRKWNAAIVYSSVVSTDWPFFGWFATVAKTPEVK